jgi:hypothetical protein
VDTAQLVVVREETPGGTHFFPMMNQVITFDVLLCRRESGLWWLMGESIRVELRKEEASLTRLFGRTVRSMGV